jgi:hypothetical protein
LMNENSIYMGAHLSTPNIRIPKTQNTVNPLPASDEGAKMYLIWLEIGRCWLRVWILVSRKGAKTHWGLSFKDSIWEFHTSIQQRRKSL